MKQIRPANSWTFLVGMTGHRTVTVRAADLDKADLKARALLDKRTPPELQPVGWTLYLAHAEYKPRPRPKPLVY